MQVGSSRPSCSGDPAHRLVVHRLGREVAWPRSCRRAAARRPASSRDRALPVRAGATMKTWTSEASSLRQPEAESPEEPELVGCGLLSLGGRSTRAPSRVDPVGTKVVRDRAIERMQPELEGRHDPKVAPTPGAPERPAFSSSLARTSSPVGRHELDGLEVVDREADPPLSDPSLRPASVPRLPCARRLRPGKRAKQLRPRRARRGASRRSLARHALR